MTYTRWQADWRNLPEQTTAINRGFLNQVEATFVSQDGRLTSLEGVTTGGVLSPTIVDVKGDLIVATANNAVTRQGVGTDGQVLTADSTLTTGVKWATPTGGSGSAPDATNSSKGIVQLAGDLGGTATAPTVPALANKADLVSGKVLTAELGSGTASSSTFLRGDQSWAVPAGGGGGVTSVTPADSSITIAGTSTAPTVAIGAITNGKLATAGGSPTSTTFLRGDRSWATPPSGGGASSVIAPVRATNPGRGQLPSGNISGINPVDGVTLVTGDRFWYQHDGTPGDSRVLVVDSSGNLVPSTDMPNGSVWNSGLQVLITEGAAEGGRTYIVSTADGSATWTAGNSSGPALKVLDAPIPTGYTNIPPSGGIFNIPPNSRSFCNVGPSGTLISLTDPPAGQRSEVYLCVQVDSAGRKFEISPGTIAWDISFQAIDGWNGPMPWDTAPNGVTFYKFTWMGDAYGYFGEVVTSLGLMYPTVAASTSWTDHGTAVFAGNSAATGMGGGGTQVLNANIVICRGVPPANMTWVYDSLLFHFSAAFRQRLFNNGYTVEVGSRWPTDGPSSVGFRGGGNMNSGGYNFANAAGHIVCATLTTFGSYEAVKGVAHESLHAMDNSYYGGANPNNPLGSQFNLISSHPTLNTLWQECVTNGGGSSARGEWFAEAERMRRGGVKSANGASDNSIVNGIYGTGSTTDTQANRITRFATFMNSLGLV